MRHAVEIGQATVFDVNIAKQNPFLYLIILDAIGRRAYRGRGGRKPSFIVVRWKNLSLASVRALQRSRGTGPRTTKKTVLRSVGP